MLVKKTNSVLRTKAQAVTDFDENLEQLVDDLFITMLENQGMGIAAPQIGVSKQVALILDRKKGQIFEIINPSILAYGGNVLPSMEGCLSLPGESYTVDRHSHIKLAYKDIKGKRRLENFFGELAIIIQHEVDHLNGVLIDERKSLRAVRPI